MPSQKARPKLTRYRPSPAVRASSYKNFSKPKSKPKAGSGKRGSGRQRSRGWGFRSTGEVIGEMVKKHLPSKGSVKRQERAYTKGGPAGSPSNRERFKSYESGKRRGARLAGMEPPKMKKGDKRVSTGVPGAGQSKQQAYDAARWKRERVDLQRAAQPKPGRGPRTSTNYIPKLKKFNKNDPDHQKWEAGHAWKPNPSVKIESKVPGSKRKISSGNYVPVQNPDKLKAQTRSAEKRIKKQSTDAWKLTDAYRKSFRGQRGPA